jgi:hypothetical protein
VPCASIAISTTCPAFSTTRKRRNSFLSETKVGRGERVVKRCCMQSARYDGINRGYYF